MGRDYATMDDGRRVLCQIRCDGRCGATIKPHPEIASSGWEKRGESRGPGDALEWYYCPECKGRL
jgi:hypothetical protein